MKNKDKEELEKQTPIIDGDARPDIDLNPEEGKKNIASVNDKGKTTRNRVDTNSMDDFKDAKTE